MMIREINPQLWSWGLPSQRLISVKMALLEEVPVKLKPNKLPDALGKLDKDSLQDHITTRSVELYHDQPKPLQVDAVSLLVQRKHTFVRAGTGFGKTRISEMFFGLFNQRVVVLCFCYMQQNAQNLIL
ncbi:hypothetical protein PSTG_00760 [Puccinia striiformis f. sp. tritici PST-78]|uniref:Uncharacterized protein n=1 Tax=Puccinia striiformis f. sp. tritici PST-78 TaxID=1165861 RepID=A0A0L0W3X8_9BASI|nr:hypothetical protein PSTG_00760 [Puccinia striiformis f. sp. tritici PST-78]